MSSPIVRPNVVYVSYPAIRDVIRRSVGASNDAKEAVIAALDQTVGEDADVIDPYVLARVMMLELRPIMSDQASWWAIHRYISSHMPPVIGEEHDLCS